MELIKQFIEKKYCAIFRAGLDALSAERLSYQSEVEAPKRFSAQQWIDENEVYAKRVDAFPFDGISILWNKNVINSCSVDIKYSRNATYLQSLYIMDYFERNK